jgi:hypothetical protein
MGVKGMFKPSKSFLYLSGRTQSNYNNNTNIRKDGVFTSFNPFYSLSSGKWNKNPDNWTFTSEVTEFSPFGAELENRDALGHYSAATFGYNQSLATGVAANAKYKEVGVDNFEDYSFNGCADNHFKFNINATQIDENNSHTGRNSIKVNSIPVTLEKQLVSECNCNLSGEQNENSMFVNYKVIGGVAPYQISWTSNIVDTEISIGEDGCSVNIVKNSSTSGEVNIKFIDRYGCIHLKQIFLRTQ